MEKIEERVGFCKEAGREVVQIKEGKEWICMHNGIPDEVEDAKADARDVQAWRLKNNK